MDCKYESGSNLIPTAKIQLQVKESKQKTISEVLTEFTFTKEKREDVICEKCSSRQECEFKIVFTNQLPSILIIDISGTKKVCLTCGDNAQIIENMCYNCNKPTTKQKVSTPINYGLTLQLKKEWFLNPGKVQQEPTYNLVSTVEQSGDLIGGHYIAYGKRGDEWYKFNSPYAKIDKHCKIVLNDF